MTGKVASGAPTVLDVLRQFDGAFAAVATALENGEFALWVGSGISSEAPSLGGLIERAIEFLRAAARDPATEKRFRPALAEALTLAEADFASLSGHLDQPFLAWPDDKREAIIGRLWNRYSALLDIRIEGEKDDFILWNAVDIRGAFASPAPPATEHLCIAILILEGAIKEIASANWDGFIEAAVETLGPGIQGNLQVVVDPRQVIIAVHDRQLFEYLRLELSPAFPADTLQTLEIMRSRDKNTQCIGTSYEFKEETAIRVA